MRNSLLTAIVAAWAAIPAAVTAQSAPTTEIAAIRAEIEALTARLERLEEGFASAAPAAAEASEALPAEARIEAAAPMLRFAGDLRYRHESINEDAVDERHRHRLRARFGVTASVADNVRLGLQLASGGDDPISANQTLDTGFDRKPIGIDRAFFAWDVTEQLTLTGGKFANPFFRPGDHHLVYDTDLNPEGLALRYTRGDWFFNYAGLWVEERDAGDDSRMLGGQVGFRRTLGDRLRVTAGASYYDYLDMQGQSPFWDGAPAGNRVDGAGGYRSDFNLAELFGELRFEPGSRPVTVFADYVVNTEADEGDLGYAVGARLGEVTGPKTWRIGYAYQDLDADAVVGTFTDSDFAGGGTDGKGHVVELNYGLRERLALGLRYFSTERGAGARDARDYHRLQADIVFNY